MRNEAADRDHSIGRVWVFYLILSLGCFPDIEKKGEKSSALKHCPARMYFDQYGTLMAQIYEK